MASDLVEVVAAYLRTLDGDDPVPDNQAEAAREAYRARATGVIAAIRDHDAQPANRSAVKCRFCYQPLEAADRVKAERDELREAADVRWCAAMAGFEWSPEAIKAAQWEVDCLAKTHRLFMPQAAPAILRAAAKAQSVVAAPRAANTDNPGSIAHRPRSDDDVAAWLKRSRDAYRPGDATARYVVDMLLDRYRECAACGLSLRPEDDGAGYP